MSGKSDDIIDDDESDHEGEEPLCMDCGGDGYVDSVVEISHRYFWDDDGPGICPNCSGTGLRKDQMWF
jgi:hypothetical protein